MGLTATAKGLTSETGYDCGYITYGNFIMELIKTAYGERCYNAFRTSLFSGKPFTDAQDEHWNSVCNDDLDIWIWHSDCDGKYTPQECRKIYNAIKDMKMDIVGHNYGVMKTYNMLEHWKYIFKHCAEKRVTLYFH